MTINRYFKILLQELTVKLDQGFVKALLALLVQETSEEREVKDIWFNNSSIYGFFGSIGNCHNFAMI